VLTVTQEQVKVDPLLSSMFSLVFPVTFLKSVAESGVIDNELHFVKRMQKVLTLFGSLTIMIAIWAFYLFLPSKKFIHFNCIQVE